ncbi:MAG: hypothetical protein GX076_08960 [Clostridiales bacterium]|nr:hypothetical protein [Clostridiales bacterium]
MKRARIILGLLLVVGAILALIYWELNGREKVLMDQVLVAKETILPGTLVTREMFMESGILEENRIEGALEPNRLNEVLGKIANQKIIKNAQITDEYFIDSKFYLNKEESVFKILPEWIYLNSSSLRRGDYVDIYEFGNSTKIGTYRVAFVKDQNDIEVRDANQKSSSILDRTDSTSIISHIEIITDLKGYEQILESVQSTTFAGLLIVQRGENTN